MSVYKLSLHPVDATTGLSDPEVVQDRLTRIGLLGPAFWLDGQRHFQTGPAFLEHLAFLGCAPVIELEPPATGLEGAARQGTFCHLHLQTVAQPRLRRRDAPLPRCPGCRRNIAAEHLAAPRIQCPECGRRTPLEALNWRQAGAYARVFLDIWGIHPAEAVPGEVLLGTLAEMTGSDWGFCYLED